MPERRLQKTREAYAGQGVSLTRMAFIVTSAVHPSSIEHLQTFIKALKQDGLTANVIEGEEHGQ